VHNTHSSLEIVRAQTRCGALGPASSSCSPERLAALPEGRAFVASGRRRCRPGRPCLGHITHSHQTPARMANVPRPPPGELLRHYAGVPCPAVLARSGALQLKAMADDGRCEARCHAQGQRSPRRRPREVGTNPLFRRLNLTLAPYWAFPLCEVTSSTVTSGW